MAFSLAVNLSPPTGTIRWALHAGLVGSAAAVLALLGGPLFSASWNCACRRRIGVELLFLSGVLGAFGASLWSTITGKGAVYYEIVAILVTVYTAGKTLTAAAKERALAETNRLRDAFASTRVLEPASGVLNVIPTPQVRRGDTILVSPGEPVPIDGVIIRGTALVQETPLTGEPHAVIRRPGDRVFAGGHSEDGELLIEASVDGKNRRLDGLLASVEASRSDLSGIEAQAHADRLAAWFLPMVAATAVGTLGFWATRGLAFDGLFHALSVLLVACPCALGLATPLAVWHVIGRLAAQGFIVKQPARLEALAGASHIVFDKTGTLTEERTTLVDFVATGGNSVRSELLSWLALIQARSNHPIARAFQTANPTAKPLPGPAPSIETELVPACGIIATVQFPAGPCHRLRIGHSDWIHEALAKENLLRQLRHSHGDQIVLVEVDGCLAAAGAVRECLRGSVADALRQLADLGVQTSILSGDSDDRVHSVLPDSLATNRPAVRGRLSPAEKSLEIESLRQRREVVAFVGDGINDAPAIASANFGIALDSGASLATATADAVLVGGDLREIPNAVRTARALTQSIRQNLIFAAFYNLIGMGLAAAGQLHPVVAAFLMVGSSGVVAWRSLRPGEHCRTDAVPVDPVDNPQLRWKPWFWFASFATQPFLLMWMGNLAATASTAAVVAFGSLAIAAFRLTRSGKLNPVASMSLAMLGPGNLGMLAGWWADAGFGPVMRDGVCLCCQSHHYFDLSGHVPWMHVGMLLSSLPWMLRPLRRFTPARPLAVGIAIQSVGMVLGMSYGADLALKWAGPMHPLQFLVAFAGMNAGMLAGMFFGCGVDQALEIALRDRRRSGLSINANPGPP